MSTIYFFVLFLFLLAASLFWRSSRLLACLSLQVSLFTYFLLFSCCLLSHEGKNVFSRNAAKVVICHNFESWSFFSCSLHDYAFEELLFDVAFNFKSTFSFVNMRMNGSSYERKTVICHEWRLLVCICLHLVWQSLSLVHAVWFLGLFLVTKALMYQLTAFEGKSGNKQLQAITWETFTLLYTALQNEAGSGLLTVISMQHMTCIYPYSTQCTSVF